MMNQVLPVIALGVLPFVSALTFQQLAAAGCSNLPGTFLISDFARWEPADNNNKSTTFLEFTYSDPTTEVTTRCHYNSTSVNVGVEGLAPRYACENPAVELIRSSNTNNQKSMILAEEVCETSDGGFLYEASGSVSMSNLTCVTTSSSYALGQGTKCFSNATLVGQEVSYEPKPTA